MKSPTRYRTYLLFSFSTICACATDDGGGDGTPAECPTVGRYLALTPGASWRYLVTDANGVFEKTQTVDALEDVGGSKAGTMAYRVTTTKVGGSVTSWQEDRGDSIHRHKELDMAGGTQTTELYDPYRTRIDESPAHLVAGASWSESYTEVVTDTMGVITSTAKTETWTVAAAEEQVTVPAGTFCALRVGRTSTTPGGAGSDKTFWFARGVGKIKEVGLSQTEELMSR